MRGLLCSPLRVAGRAGPELPCWCQGLACSLCAGASGRSAGGCGGVRARCPPIRIVMVEHTRPVSVGFPSGHGGVRLARRVICKVGFLLGPGAWWEQWVLPNESTGSAGSGGREKEVLPFPVGQEAGSHSRARGTVSLNCPRGSQSGRVLQ